MVEGTEDRLLKTVVDDKDNETALQLLKDAGGACQASDLAKLARKNQGTISSILNGRFGISLAEDGDKETLSVYSSHRNGSHAPVASLTQKKCARQMAEGANEGLLLKAVVHDDAETALQVLKNAGEACQAHDLAKLAQKNQSIDSRVSDGRFGINLGEDGDKETLSVYVYHRKGFYAPVASLTQKKCVR
jgi:hypothetical protein